MSPFHHVKTARLLCAAILAAVLWPSPSQAADCQLSFGTLNICKRCTTNLTASTSRDTACTGYPQRNYPANVSPPIMLEGRVSKQAVHGKAAMAGGSWLYTPKKGFTGRDSFTIERTALSNEQLYVLYIKIDMEVRP